VDRFQQQVRDAYTACRQAVQDELAVHRPATETPPRHTSPTDNDSPELAHKGDQDSHRATNGNGGYAASQKQLTYIQQLARQIKGLGLRRLESLARQMYGKALQDLSSLEASALIDQLKALKSGELNLEELLQGAAA
jgi:hypothetical protein